MAKTQSLSSFVSDLQKLPQLIRQSIGKTMGGEIQGIVNDLRRRSPIDSGVFSHNWDAKAQFRSGSLATYRIQNRTPYSGVLDEGAEIAGAPWYFPNAKNPGPVSNSGKLKVTNNRVWAGGLSPSGFVIGGISDYVLNDRRIEQTARRISISVIGVFQ